MTQQQGSTTVGNDLKALVEHLRSRMGSLDSDFKALQELHTILQPASKMDLTALQGRVRSLEQSLRDLDTRYAPSTPGGPDLESRMRELLRELSTADGKAKATLVGLSDQAISSTFGAALLDEFDRRMQVRSAEGLRARLEKSVEIMRKSRRHLRYWQILLMGLAIAVPAALGVSLYRMRAPLPLIVVLCCLAAFAAFAGMAILGNELRAVRKREQELEDKRLMLN